MYISVWLYKSFCAYHLNLIIVEYESRPVCVCVRARPLYAPLEEKGKRKWRKLRFSITAYILNA